MVGKYPMIDEVRNVARFVYRNLPRVVRVVSIENGNVTGYETRKGDCIVNKRYAPIKAYNVTRMKGGSLTIKAR